MQSVFVVSDLHMFCRRSDWEEHVALIHEAAEEADLFVFNGDTVDFKWSVLPSLEATIDSAIDFLRDFCTRHPQCKVHVNLGNHDHIQDFIARLETLNEEIENFTWHPYFLRVGKALFLHGDVANWKMSHQQLEQYRGRWERRHRVQSDFKNRVYDAAFQAGAHIAVSRMAFTPKRTVKRVAAYMDDIGHGIDSGVERVYFGHTHVPVHGYAYGGMTFHNGGAPMRGIQFRLIKAHI